MRKRGMALLGAAALIGVMLLGSLSPALAQTRPGPGNGPGYGPGYGQRDEGAGPFGPGYGPMRRGGGMMGGGNARQSGPGGGMWSGDLAAHFIQEMIPHHQDAVVMADLALAQAEHQELRDLAASIKQVQTQEIEQMRQWYQAWYGTEVPPSFMAQMPMHASMDPQAINGAQPFDKAFVELMIPHHAMAVMMSNHALVGVQQPELRALLESIISSQSAEIQQMQQWYRDWYGQDPPSYGPGHGPMHGPGHGPMRGPGWGPSGPPRQGPATP